MNLTIEENSALEETEIVVKCAYIDASLEKLIAQIRSFSNTIKGMREGNIFQISIEEIEYIESVNEQTQFYVNDEQFQSDKKLYELEDLLKAMGFVRISKSCVVNVNQLQHVTPLFDGKFEALTRQGTLLIINRHYVKKFKEAFGL